MYLNLVTLILLSRKHKKPIIILKLKNLKMKTDLNGCSTCEVGEPVLIEKRFKVYQRALEIYEEKLRNPNKIYYGIRSMAMGLLLPCILWDLKNYLDDLPDEQPWDTPDTPIMFPEIIGVTEQLEGVYGIDRITKCIEILKQIINEQPAETETKA